MEIRNAVIITKDNQPILMSIEELRNFTGNTVLCRSKLTAEELAVIDRLSFKEADNEADG